LATSPTGRLPLVEILAPVSQPAGMHLVELTCKACRVVVGLLHERSNRKVRLVRDGLWRRGLRDLEEFLVGMANI